MVLLLVSTPLATLSTLTDMRDAYADSNLAGVAYASSILSSSVKYREWIPSTESWSPEVSLQDTGSQVVDAKILFSSTSSLRAILSASTNGDLNLFTCSALCTSAGSWTHVGGASFANTGLLSLLSTSPKRPFDMAFENGSGDLVLVYDKGLKLSNRLYYRVFSAASETLSAESSHQYSGGLIVHPINYVRMASNPGSDDITMIFYDGLAFSSYAVVWNPSSDVWQNQITVSSSMAPTSLTGESVGVAYETDSGASVVFSASGLNSAAYARWNGASWSGVSTTDPESGSILNAVVFVSMKADPAATSDKIMICQSGLSLTCAEIDSGIFGSWANPGPQPLTLLSRAFDFAWDPSGSTGILVSETGLNDYSSAIWTGGSWTTGQTISSSVGHLWVQAATNPFDNDSTNSIFVGSNVLNELDYLTYDGTSLDLQSGGLSVSHLGSALYEGASIDFGQDLSSIPQSYSAPVVDSISLSDAASRGLAAQGVLADSLNILGQVSRQFSRENLLSDLFAVIDAVLSALGSGAGASESVPILDSVSVFKTSAISALASESIFISDITSVTKTAGSAPNNSGGNGGGGGTRDNDPRDLEIPSALAWPTGGQYESVQSVTITADEPATIYYALDGTSPTMNGAIYSSPITISSNTTLMFFAVDEAGNAGDIVAMTYVINSKSESDANATNSIPGQFSQERGSSDSGGSDNADSSEGKTDGAAGTGENAAGEQEDNGAQDSADAAVKIPVGSELGYTLPAYDGIADIRNIAIIFAAILTPAVLAPTILLHLANRKAIFIDGILIDGSSIGQARVDSSNLLATFVELQYDLCWTTGLGVEDIKLVLDNGTASSLGLANKPEQIGNSILIAKDSEFIVEKLRNELEKRIVVSGEKWFILGRDDYRYSKKKFEKILSGIPEGEYRDHQIHTLLESYVHLNLILESAANPRFLMTGEGNILYNNRFVHNLKFKSRYGNAKSIAKDQWIEDQLAKVGVKLTHEGAKLMSYGEKYELLISAGVEALAIGSLQEKSVSSQTLDS